VTKIVLHAGKQQSRIVTHDVKTVGDFFEIIIENFQFFKVVIALKDIFWLQCIEKYCEFWLGPRLFSFLGIRFHEAAD
jgi:hypothetical protein